MVSGVHIGGVGRKSLNGHLQSSGESQSKSAGDTSRNALSIAALNRRFQPSDLSLDANRNNHSRINSKAKIEEPN